MPELTASGLHGAGGWRARFWPRLLALFVFCIGLVNILSALVGIEKGRLALLLENLPLEVTHTSRTLAVLSGLLLMLLSLSLLKRKRRAWLAAALLLAGSVVFHLLKGLDYEEAGLSLLVLLALLASRRRFMVSSDRAAFGVAAMLAGAMLIGALAYGILGFALLHRHFTPDFTLGRALSSTVMLLTQLGPPVLEPLGRHRDALWFSDSLVAAAAFTVLYIAGLLVRPVSLRLGRHSDGREEALPLLRAHGGGGLAYYTLMPGLAYIFGPQRCSYLALRVIDGWAMVLGDPVGDPAEIPELLARFRTQCEASDWQAVWYQVTPELLPLLRTEKVQVLPLGEEALIDLPSFSLSGKSMQSLRTARSRVEREGCSIEEYDLAADPRHWRGTLHDISSAWLRQRRGRELGFSLGTWELALRFAAEQRFWVLADSAGQPQAFVSFTPVYGAEAGIQGWQLDLLRRSEGAPPGTMEALVLAAVLAMQAEGCALCSLALSPLSGESGLPIEGNPDFIERGRGLIYEHLGRLYNFEGLHRFKQKFQPRWVPRYLVCSSLLSLPQAIVALTRAHLQTE